MSVVKFVLLPTAIVALIALPSISAAPTNVNCSATWAQQNCNTGVDTAVFNCPANCTASSSGHVFGDVIYHKDSSLCLAAIHAGAFANNFGGHFLLSVLDGVAEYKNVSRNGVDSLIHAGNDAIDKHEGAFLARPKAVTTVDKSVNNKEVKVTGWEEVKGETTEI